LIEVSSVTVIDPPLFGGTFVNSSTGEIQYTPDTGYFGLDNFTYQITDDDGASDSAMVFITIVHINQIPLAQDDYYVLNEDEELEILAPGVLINDTDPDSSPNPLSAILYTSPVNGRVRIQNIQVTNQGGSKIVQAKINDNSDSNTSNLIAYANISGPTICNIAKGPIVLEESDSLTLETNDTTNITAVCSILEISREDQNG